MQFGLTNLLYVCHSVQIVFCLISVKLRDEWLRSEHIIHHTVYLLALLHYK